MYLFGCLPAARSCCIFDKGYFANDFGIYRFTCQSSLISLSSGASWEGRVICHQTGVPFACIGLFSVTLRDGGIPHSRSAVVFFCICWEWIRMTMRCWCRKTFGSFHWIRIFLETHSQVGCSVFHLMDGDKVSVCFHLTLIKLPSAPPRFLFWGIYKLNIHVHTCETMSGLFSTSGFVFRLLLISSITRLSPDFCYITCKPADRPPPCQIVKMVTNVFSCSCRYRGGWKSDSKSQCCVENKCDVISIHISGSDGVKATETKRVSSWSSPLGVYFSFSLPSTSTTRSSPPTCTAHLLITHLLKLTDGATCLFFFFGPDGRRWQKKKKNPAHFEHMLLLSVECVLFGEDTTTTQVVINDWAVLDLAAPSQRDCELQR